jgi:hypothetical protein
MRIPVGVDKMLEYYVKPEGNTGATQILDPIMIASTTRCNDDKFKPNFFFKELDAAKSGQEKLKSIVVVFLEGSQRKYIWFDKSLFNPPTELEGCKQCNQSLSSRRQEWVEL